MNRAKEANRMVPTQVNCHTKLKAIDHITRIGKTEARPALGKTIGKVTLPISLSPSSSLKSCVCIVVANTAVLSATDRHATASICDASQPSININLLPLTRGKNYSPAINVPPSSKVVNPMAVTMFFVIQ